MLVPLHDCFGDHYVLPRHSYALEDGSAVCASVRWPRTMSTIGDQIVCADGPRLRQNDVTRLTQCGSGILDNDVGAPMSGPSSSRA